MNRLRNIAVASAAVMALTASGMVTPAADAQGVAEKQFNHPINKDTADVVLGGYDLVAYFDDKSATKGSGEHAVKYGGNIYYFANEEHQEMFITNPAKYLPRFGGFCPVNLRQGTAEKGNPKHFIVHEGRLYICASASAHETFEGDPEAIIDKAEQNVVNFPDYLERGR